MSADHKDEYARSSPDTRGLRVAKEQLYADGFPVEKTRAVAAQYFQPEKFAHLRDQPGLTFLVAPSTSGENTLPLAFAQLLKKEYGGQIITNWATPDASQRTATMDGITKMRNAPTYTINREVGATIKPEATLVLVDDVVTTGGSIAAMREALAREGKRIEQIASLAQSDMRKVHDADIDRIVTKLGDPSLRPDVALALDGRLKHFSNYIETSIRKTDADRNAEISSYFKTEAARLRELGRTDAGAVLGIGERIARLESVQSRESARAEIPTGLSRESRDVRPSQDRQENGRGLNAESDKSPAYYIISTPDRDQIIPARSATEAYAFMEESLKASVLWSQEMYGPGGHSPDGPSEYDRPYKPSDVQVNLATAENIPPQWAQYLPAKVPDSPRFMITKEARPLEHHAFKETSNAFTNDIGSHHVDHKPHAITREDKAPAGLHTERANATEALLTRLDALREEYAEKPDHDKAEEAREIASDQGGPDVTRIPLAVAAQEYVEGHTSRANLELMAAQNDQAKDAREQNQTHTAEVSRDEDRSISDDR